MTSIKWNPKVKLILTDVDSTVADVYTPADKLLIKKLINLLRNGVSIFFVTNGGLKRVKRDIVDFIPKELRQKILISHCTGAEVWGFEKSGDLNEKPYYSHYEDLFNENKKKTFRNIVDQIVREFKFKTYPAMPKNKFREITKGDPLSIMCDDRGPQITFELINANDLEPDMAASLEVKVPLTHGAYDLRVPVAERADQLFRDSNIPVVSRIEAIFALNFAIKGISKETSIKYVFGNSEIIEKVGLKDVDLDNPELMEIWGDKFSEIGGPDKHMCEAVNSKVRAIDFREEKPEDLPKDYNIVIWDGNKHLEEGLLEYLKRA